MLIGCCLICLEGRSFSLHYREENRQQEIKDLTSRGIVPREKDLEEHPEKMINAQPYAMGLVAAVINDILPAKVIVENMVGDAARILRASAAKVNPQAKL